MFRVALIAIVLLTGCATSTQSKKTEKSFACRYEPYCASLTAAEYQKQRELDLILVRTE